MIELKDKIDLALDDENSSSFIKRIGGLEKTTDFGLCEENIFWEKKRRVAHKWEQNTQNFIIPLQNNEKHIINQIINIKDKHGKLVESEIEVENVAPLSLA